MAIKNQVMNAKAMDIWNLLHGICISALQKSRSLAYSTITPADEHAAASDKVAVTCTSNNYFHTMCYKKIALQSRNREMIIPDRMCLVSKLHDSSR